MDIKFTKLNDTWDADPNAPYPDVTVLGNDIRLRFVLSPFTRGNPNRKRCYATIWFKNCSKYRLGIVNDHGFYLGQCRFSKTCPNWGDFYLIEGDQDILDQPEDWVQVNGNGTRHFLYYFRDETIECSAESWEMDDEIKEMPDV